MLNLHHLELFYYVAKYEGIMPACRHIPYGVQQPAVSAQIIRLEEELGMALFRRRPFRLTASGQMLFEYLAPFFGNLPALEARLRGATASVLRLAGLSEVMRDHAPDLLARLKVRHPDLQLTVQEAHQEQAAYLILHGEADLAVTVLDDAPPAGLHCRHLLRLPLALLVDERSEWLTANAAIAAGAKGKLNLISLGAHELMPRLFARGLKKAGKEWPAAITVSSADLIPAYVARGLGAGLMASTTHRPVPPGLRELPLKGFPPVNVGAFWSGRLGPVAKELLADITAVAKAR